MKKNEIEDRKNKILAIVALKGPLSKYEIHKELKDKIPRISAIQRLVKSLADMRYLEVHAKEAGAHKKKTFRITPNGLLETIGSPEVQRKKDVFLAVRNWASNDPQAIKIEPELPEILKDEDLTVELLTYWSKLWKTSKRLEGLNVTTIDPKVWMRFIPPNSLIRKLYRFPNFRKSYEEQLHAIQKQIEQYRKEIIARA